MANGCYSSLRQMWIELEAVEKISNPDFEGFKEEDKLHANSIILKLNSTFPRGVCHEEDLYEAGCDEKQKIGWLKAARVLKTDPYGIHFPLIG